MARIVMDHVELEYPTYTNVTRSLRTRVFEKLGGQISPHNRTIVVKALDKVSFELNDGDRLGVIGHNGAGKTSLLRTISGVYRPTGGRMSVEGSIAALTDMTLGMDHEANGWDNIILRCVFLGMTFKEARERANEIAEFSELGSFLDLPIRTYSAGMYVRLAFAVSTAVESDILIMDEMIGAGDAGFVAKARQRIFDLLTRTRIVILASHYPHVITAFTNRVLWLEKGGIRALGATAEIVERYRAEADGNAAIQPEPAVQLEEAS